MTCLSKRNLPTVRFEIEPRGSAHSLAKSAVICSDVMEHLFDLPQFSSEVARVLKPGGIYGFDTINRTFKSWLIAVIIAQEWWHVIPPSTHNWKLFIKPQEVESLFSSKGLKVAPRSDIVGLRPTFTPIRFLRYISDPSRYDTAAASWRGFGPFVRTRDSDLQYLWWAKKSS